MTISLEHGNLRPPAPGAGNSVEWRVDPRGALTRINAKSGGSGLLRGFRLKATIIQGGACHMNGRSTATIASEAPLEPLAGVARPGSAPMRGFLLWHLA
jgi:hypothetical protein